MQGTLKMLLQHHSLKASILQRSAFFTIHLSYPYMTTGNTTALTIWTFISKVISLLLNKLYKIKGRNRNSQEIEENNRIGKTRDLFKNIRDTKGTFHAKMGTIKDRNDMDLQKQKILRRGGKNTQENRTKKVLMTQITTMVWSLTYSQTSWSAKSSGPYEASLWTKLVEVMDFQLSYFKSWKTMLWKCGTQYASKLGKLSSGHRTGKGQFSFQSQRKAMPKNAPTTAQLHSSHTLVK